MIRNFLRQKSNRKKLLEKFDENPTTFDILEKHFNNEEFKELLVSLIYSPKVSTLILHDLLSDLDQTTLLADFIENNKFHKIKNISILSPFARNQEIQILFNAFQDNYHLKKIDLSDTPLEKKNFYMLLEKISNNTNIEVLILNSICLKFTQEIANKINEFSNKNHNISIDISNNIVESAEIVTALKANNKIILDNFILEMFDDVVEVTGGITDTI